MFCFLGFFFVLLVWKIHNPTIETVYEGPLKAKSYMEIHDTTFILPKGHTGPALILEDSVTNVVVRGCTFCSAE